MIACHDRRRRRQSKKTPTTKKLTADTCLVPLCVSVRRFLRLVLGILLRRRRLASIFLRLQSWSFLCAPESPVARASCGAAEPARARALREFLLFLRSSSLLRLDSDSRAAAPPLLLRARLLALPAELLTKNRRAAGAARSAALFLLLE